MASAVQITKKGKKFSTSSATRNTISHFYKNATPTSTPAPKISSSTTAPDLCRIVNMHGEAA